MLSCRRLRGSSADARACEAVEGGTATQAACSMAEEVGTPAASEAFLSTAKFAR